MLQCTLKIISTYCESSQYVGTNSDTKSNHTAKPVNIKYGTIITHYTVDKCNYKCTTSVTTDFTNTRVTVQH